jgi:hypothetical protein
MQNLTPAALVAAAQRVADKAGLDIRKSQLRERSTDNWGGFMLIGALCGTVVAADRFELEPEDVIAICGKAEAEMEGGVPFFEVWERIGDDLRAAKELADRAIETAMRSQPSRSKRRPNGRPEPDALS